jgi:3-mercaptopyruvate sulfurtransferase SseA
MGFEAAALEGGFDAWRAEHRLVRTEEAYAG